MPRSSSAKPEPYLHPDIAAYSLLPAKSFLRRTGLSLLPSPFYQGEDQGGGLSPPQESKPTPTPALPLIEGRGGNTVMRSTRPFALVSHGAGAPEAA